MLRGRYGNCENENPNPQRVFSRRWDACLILFLAFCCVIITMACSPKGPRFGVDYNQERAKRGIPLLPLLPSGWETERYSDEIRYTNPIKTGPRHSIKSVWLDPNGAIVKETDTFYSGRSFKGGPEAVTLFETIVVNYEYEPGPEKERWSVNAILPPNGLTNLTVAAADETLAKWELIRVPTNSTSSVK
jgi:hypothetical protein